MEATFQDLGFYHVNLEYLRYLHGVDSEVQFSESKNQVVSARCAAIIPD